MNLLKFRIEQWFKKTSTRFKLGRQNMFTISRVLAYKKTLIKRIGPLLSQIKNNVTLTPEKKHL